MIKFSFDPTVEVMLIVLVALTAATTTLIVKTIFEMRYDYQYAVVFTYSFDYDAAVYTFRDIESAKNYLRDNYAEEIRIQTEENSVETDGFISEDGMYAKITTNCDDGSDFISVTEIHIARLYE